MNLVISDLKWKLVLLALFAALSFLAFLFYRSPAMAYLLSEFRIC